MGGAIVLPDPDDRMERAIALAKLKPKELGVWWKLFQKFDKRVRTHLKTGRVNLETFWTAIGEARSIYTDALLDMLDIDHSGSLDFGQWLLVCVAFCLFSEAEMCKYIYFVFDKDKDGYFEEEEMKLIIAILYRLAPNDRLKGNEYRSWLKVEICEDGRIEPDEFKEINRMHPRLFYPAFRLQQNMIIHTAGRFWWSRKKNALQIRKDMKRLVMESKKKEQQRKLQAKRDRRLRRRMGAVSYYLCFWRRENARKKMNETGKEDFTEEEEKYEIDRAREQAIEKYIKNPETLEWHTYKEHHTTESKEQTIAQTVEVSIKQRSQRKVGRQERKRSRKHQFRAATQGIRIP